MNRPPNNEPDERGAEELAGLFPAGGHEFQMRMRRRSIAEYFRASPRAGSVLNERRRWLREDLARCFAFRPEAEALAVEACELLEAAAAPISTAAAPVDPGERFLDVSRRLEPDLALLRPDSAGDFMMVAGAVCFPSSWSLTGKLGRSIAEIHAPVPTLNEQLGPSISQFLRRMTPGIAWCRENWGLSASPELNQHPARALPRLTSDATIEDVWLRVERQALVALPDTGGVLFAIRVEVSPLRQVVVHPGCRAGLRRALETMPEPVSVYKGLGVVRDRLVELLRH